VRIGSVKLLDEGGREAAAIELPSGPILVGDLVPGLSCDLDLVLESGRLDEVRERLRRGVARPTARPLAPAPALRRPEKILGIGLNFRAHAEDLAEAAPSEEPASFFKPRSTIVGPGDAIRLPPESRRVTAEAELAVVIGAPSRGLADPAGAVLGYLPALDMTAEDILRRNPRFLTRAKSFDTFLALGQWIVTPDEIGRPLEAVRVSTVRNGAAAKSAALAAMTFGPRELVAFHSRVFPWRPGDLLLTGTPGAVVIEPGDEVAAIVEGVGSVACRVARGA